MNPGDKDKLNECIAILDTTDLGLSLVWLWTWSTIKDILSDTEQYKAKATEDQVWEGLCEAVGNGAGFSLEFGAEAHQEDTIEWMIDKDFISSRWLEDEEEEQDPFTNSCKCYIINISLERGQNDNKA